MIKETTGKHGVIRTNTYAHSISYFMELVREAKRDFPNLEDKDIIVSHYAGRRYRNTFGIEFPIQDATIPETYHKISSLESTLG